MKKNTAKVFAAGEGKLKSLLGFISFAFTTPGRAILKKVAGRMLHKVGLFNEKQATYQDWLDTYLAPANLAQKFRTVYPTLEQKPLFSIIISAMKEKDGNAEATFSSINAQSYPHWELLTVNPGDNTSPLSAAAGNYVLFVHQGTLLTPNCLFEFAVRLNSSPDATIIYSDHDTISSTGTYIDPYFKPSWSPDTFLSRNYIGDAFIIATHIARTIYTPGYFNNSTLYDLLLRATEQTTTIYNIPTILFHFPEHNSTAIAEEQAINAALQRRGTPATIAPAGINAYAIDYLVRSVSKVSIIIPTKDQASLLRTAIDSIFNKTTYPDYEIIVLNNNSNTTEFFALVEEYTAAYPDKFRCVDANFPFNYPRLMNMGVSESNGDYILLLNNDVEVIDPDWLTKMVGYAQHTHVGAVGAKLLYPDGTIQHAGIVMGINGDAGHIFANAPRSAPGYFGSLLSATNYAALTAACLMLRKELYLQVGGMNETLTIEYNDLDLCLRLFKRGHYNVCLPVELYHHESATRGHPFRSKASWLQHEKDFATFKNEWGNIIDNDPFYNPNLTIKATDYRLK